MHIAFLMLAVRNKVYDIYMLVITRDNILKEELIKSKGTCCTSNTKGLVRRVWDSFR